jgi:hypothetical protein
MSYILKKTDVAYNIYEKGSDVLIELSLEEKKAKDLCRKLNLGSGFNGWTPTFFAVKHKVKEEQ